MNINLLRQFVRIVIFILPVMLLAGCGGGGDSSSGGSNQSQGTNSVLLKTSHLLNGDTVYGAMEMTISFPSGIIIALDPITGNPAADAVKLVGATNPAMTFSRIKYTPAPAGGNGTLKLQLYDTNGFNGNGTEYLSIQFFALPGIFPKSSDFTLSNFSVSDLNGVVSSISSPTITFAFN